MLPLCILSQINKKQRETVKNLVENYDEGSSHRFCLRSFTRWKIVQKKGNVRLIEPSPLVEGISSIHEWISSSELDIMAILPKIIIFVNLLSLQQNRKKFIIVEVFPHVIYVVTTVEWNISNFKSLRKRILRKNSVTHTSVSQ